jgi:hypothetical protein
MGKNVSCWGVHPKSVDMGKDLLLDIAGEARLVQPGWCGSNHVDWRGPWCVMARGIKNLMVLFAGFLQNVLGSEKKVWCEPSYPMWQRDDEIVSVFLVYCVLHLREFFINRGVVSKVPVE